MSGAYDFVTEKVFKPVREFVTKIWDNKMLRTVIIAAAIVYTAGVASGAWTWTLQTPATTTFTTASMGSMATGNAAALNSSAVTGAGVTGVEAGTGALVGGAAPAAPAVGGAAAAAAPVSVSPIAAADAAAGGLGAVEGGAGTDFAASYVAGPAEGGGGLINSVSNGLSATGGWMADNTMATMMIGSGMANAAGAREDRKNADAARAHDAALVANVGVGGFNNMGAYAAPVNTPPAPPGSINSATAPIALAGNATAARPIPRDKLQLIGKQGLVAPAQPVRNV